MNKYSNCQHIFYFCHNWFRGRPSPHVRCTVTVFRLHIRIHCHRNTSIRYSDEYQQARSLARSPYQPRQIRNDILDLRGGALLLLRRVLRGAVSLTLRTQIGRPEGAQLFGNDYILYLQYHWTYLNQIWCVIYLYGQCMICRNGFICMCIFKDMAVCFGQWGCATTNIIPSHKTYVWVRSCLESLTRIFISQMR